MRSWARDITGASTWPCSPAKKLLINSIMSIFVVSTPFRLHIFHIFLASEAPLWRCCFVVIVECMPSSEFIFWSAHTLSPDSLLLQMPTTVHIAAHCLSDPSTIHFNLFWGRCWCWWWWCSCFRESECTLFIIVPRGQIFILE